MASTWGKCFFCPILLGQNCRHRKGLWFAVSLLKVRVWMQMLTFQWKFPKHLVKIVEFHPKPPLARDLSLALCSYWLGLSADGPRFILTDPSCHSLSARWEVKPIEYGRRSKTSFCWLEKTCRWCNSLDIWMIFVSGLNMFALVFVDDEAAWRQLKAYIGCKKLTKHLKWRGIHYFWGPGAWDLLILLACNIAITQAHRAHTFFGKGIFTKKMLGRFWQTASRCSLVYETVFPTNWIKYIYIYI